MQRGFEQGGDGRRLRGEQPYERCCLCGTLTDVRRDTPVDARRYYVVGAGQLCERCWLEVYGAAGLRPM